MCKINKRIVVLMWALTLLMLVSCKQESNDTDIKAIAQKIENVLDMEKFKRVSIFSEGVAEEYGLAPSDIKEGYVIMPVNDDIPDRVVIIEAAGIEQLKTVDLALANKRVDLDKAWEHSDDIQYKKIETAEKKARGQSVIFVISDKKEEVMNVFDKEVVNS